MKIFNSQQEERIMHAINIAENHTSGEIRVCIEKKCSSEVMIQAAKRFNELNMHKTALKNGVLIYLATDDHKFAIIGDEGINKKVPDNFWEETKNIMADLFKKEQFAEGLITGIVRAGEQLKTFFPRSDDDINELPNEVVYFLENRKTRFIKLPMKVLKFFSILLLSVFLVHISYADDFPERSNRLVNDYTNILSKDQIQQLENKLVAFDDSTTIQIAIVLIPSLQDYEVADYAVRLAQKWGIGDKENDSGILLLASIGDRKVTIQTGYGVEGAIPDAIAYQIINNEIKPAFTRQDYFTGLNDATNSLMAYTQGEYKAQKKENTNGINISTIIFVVIFFVVISIISKGGNNGRGGGKVMGSRGSSDLLWWTLQGGLGNHRGGSSNRGGGFGGGRGFGGGGGFGGFGGGSFGGGGASGGW